MLAGAVLDVRCTREWRSLVLKLVERRLRCDLQLRCGLRPLKYDHADVRARLCRLRDGNVEQRPPTNVCPCDMLDVEQRIE